MYEQHFGLSGRPFPALPADWQLFMSESLASVVPALLHTLCADSGVAVITGPSGIGKTVLLHHLRESVERDGRALIVPGTSLTSVGEFHTALARLLERSASVTTAGDAGRWNIVERLEKAAEFWGPLTILIDDAHLMKPDIYGELQFLLEQRQASSATCRVLLAGSLQLEETLAQPALFGFAQRLRTYCFLEPLRQKESVEYLAHQLQLVQGSLARLFDSRSVELVVEAADGNPRCLNLLADECLLLAARGEETQVNAEVVHLAFDRLQHLPHSWNISPDRTVVSGSPATEAAAGVVEYGGDGVIEVGAPMPHSAASVPQPAALTESNAPVVNSCVEIGACTADGDTDVVAANFSDEEETVDAPAGLLPDSAVAGEVPEWISDPERALAEFELCEDDLADSHLSDKVVNPFCQRYDLAELEPVGDPAVEIDADLDRRLLQVAETSVVVECEQSEVDELASDAIDQPIEESSADFDDLLSEYPLWNPPGAWRRPFDDSGRIEAWLLRTASASVDSEQSQVSEKCGTVGTYSLVIPPPEEIAACWPPALTGVSPSAPIEVTELPDADERSGTFDRLRNQRAVERSADGAEQDDVEDALQMLQSERRVSGDLHQRPLPSGPSVPRRMTPALPRQIGVPVSDAREDAASSARLSISSLLQQARQSLSAEPPQYLRRAAGAESFAIPLPITRVEETEPQGGPELRAFPDDSGSTAEEVVLPTAAERESALRTLFTRLRNRR